MEYLLGIYAMQKKFGKENNTYSEEIFQPKIHYKYSIWETVNCDGPFPIRYSTRMEYLCGMFVWNI